MGVDKIINKNTFEAKYMLAEYNLPVTTFTKPQRVITHRLLHFIQDLAVELNVPDLWLPIVETQPSKPFTLLDKGILSNRTVGEALLFLSKYAQFFMDNLEIKLEIKSNYAWVIFKGPYGRGFSVSKSLALCRFQKRMNYLLPTKCQPSAAYLTTKYSEKFANYFGAPVLFEAKFNALVYPSNYLNMVIGKYDPELIQAVSKKMEDRIFGGFKRQVEKIIDSQLKNNPGQLNIGSVSHFIGIKPRTLQFKLLKEDESFQEILDSRRLEKAKKYLSSSELSMSDISQVIGLSGASGFSQWFKHHVGVSPLNWRNFKISKKIRLGPR